MFLLVIIGFGVVCNALGIPLFQPVTPGTVPVTSTTPRRLAVPQIIEIYDNSIADLPNNPNRTTENTQLVYLKSALGPYTYSVVPVPRLRSFPGKRQFIWSGSSPMSSRFASPVANQTAKVLQVPTIKKPSS